MKYIDFTGTAYLGLSHNLDFIDLIHKGIEKYGINFGGSRLNNAVPDIYRIAESFFAEKLYCRDSLLTSSGTLGGILLSRFLKKNDFNVFISSDLHPALRDNFISFNEFNELSEVLPAINSTEQNMRNAVLLNTINPVTLKTIDVNDILKFKNKKNTLFVLDDSHGIGINGDENWGISGLLHKNGLKYIILSSLAKAFSLQGGIIAGDKFIIDSIKKESSWGGASPPPAFYFYALINGESIVAQQIEKLKQNIIYFSEKLRPDNSLVYIPDFPIFINKGKSLYEFLYSKGIIISAFRYPTKNDPLTERIVINANHSFEDLDFLRSFI